jgi:putative cardiolipin synthase
MTSFRRAAALCATAAAILLAGCGALPLRADLPVTTALPPAPDSPLVRIAEASIPAPDQTGFRLMPLGVYSLDTRIQLAQRAKYSLDLQYYLIQNDGTGRLLLRSLRDAALRGVRVRLLVDDLYTSGSDPLLIGLAALPNFEVRLFNPFCCDRDSVASKYVYSFAHFKRLNHRMHNKLFIADGAMVVAGGRNIADEYFNRSATDNFVDMDGFMIGAVVPQLTRIFDNYWNSPQVYPAEDIIHTGFDRARLRNDLDDYLDDGKVPELVLPSNDILGYGPISEDLDAGRVGLIWGKATAYSDPPAKVTAKSEEEARKLSVNLSVITMIRAANSEVVVVSPYFIPGRTGIEAMAKLRARGVKLTLLTNSLASNDVPLAHTGFARYRVDMLRLGVDIYELSPTRVRKNKRLFIPGTSLGRLHFKTVVIDEATVFIGSMNLDPRSASKNTELGIVAESPQLAREVIRVIQISKLQSAYRLRFGPDGKSLQWLTADEQGEVVLTEEPDVTPFARFQSMLLSPFVPEQEL